MRSVLLISVTLMTFAVDLRVEAQELPIIPEPMVFDLVRPLGARKGELELNTLALKTIKTGRSSLEETPDPFGLVPFSEEQGKLEWAPEVEYAFADGAAIEFELPMEGGKVEAYKLAGQYTLGALTPDGIHGFQSIAQYNIESQTTSVTGLYLAGYRFSERISLLSMTGVRQEIGGSSVRSSEERTDLLQNTTLFITVADHFIFGLETNLAYGLSGNKNLLMIPQVSYEFNDTVSVQVGIGVRRASGDTGVEVGSRLIFVL